MKLKTFFKENPRVALAFSGGVDSSYLLYAGLHYGADIRPYFIKTAFQPHFEFEDARLLTKQLGVKLHEIEIDILHSQTIVSNTFDRCYHCKSVLFGELKMHAFSDGYEVIIDGTNASDDETGRPGMRAMQELSICSPLRECGLTKDEIRRLSKEAKLLTWNKPAYACLATRVPTGISLTAEMLGRIEKAENALFKLGFRDFRVRVFSEAARIQVRSEDMAKAIELANEIRNVLKPCFQVVLLDLESR